jgi:hypothetical protein
MPRARNAIASTATRTPRIVTTRTPLFDEAGWREDGADLGEMRSGIFLRGGLDVANQIDWVEEISFLAQPACGRNAASVARMSAAICGESRMSLRSSGLQGSSRAQRYAGNPGCRFAHPGYKAPAERDASQRKRKQVRCATPNSAAAPSPRQTDQEAQWSRCR